MRSPFGSGPDRYTGRSSGWRPRQGWSWLQLDPSDSAPPQPRTPVLAVDLPAPAFAVRYRLTRRESEVLGLVAAGRSNSEIGDLLFISRKTVAVHLANVKAKLGASSRVQMAILARDAGLVAERAHADLKRGAGQAPASPT